MTIGQVWSKASLDGTVLGNGGRGSVIAVTAENPGPDGLWDTADDIAAPLSAEEIWVSHDKQPGSSDNDLTDRIRNFASVHTGGAYFAYADGSVAFVSTDIEPKVYRAISTRNGSESVASHSNN